MTTGLRLAGEHALVTGGAAGIGRAIALRFAAEGCAVTVLDVNDPAETVAACRALGAEATAMCGDVTSETDVRGAVDAAAAANGPLSVLVNNAATCRGDNLVEMDTAVWDSDVAVNLTAHFLTTRAVLPSMIERRHGSIVTIASVNAQAYFGNEAYSAAKAGVISLTRSIAVRYGRFGVRANTVAPGSVRTPIWEARIAREPEVLDRLTRFYPLGRVGEPEDVANAVLFLASAEASWISGTVLNVDGGLMAGNDVMTSELLVESRDEGTGGYATPDA